MTTYRLYDSHGEIVSEGADKVAILHDILSYDGHQYEVNGERGYGVLTADMRDFEVRFSQRGGGGNVPMTAPVWFADIDQLFDAALDDNRYGLSVETVEPVTDINGRAIDMDAAVMLMDDDLREDIAENFQGGWDNPQAFLAEYARRHREQFGEDFAPYTGGAW